MRKRPLCLIWIALMVAVWILKAADAPVFGAPRLDRAGRALLNGAAEQETPHDLPAGGAVLLAQGTVSTRRETKKTMQYVLRHVLLTDNISSQTNQADVRPVYFPKLILTTSKDDTICRIGAVIQCTGEVRRIDAATNPGQFDARAYYACQGIYYNMRSDRIKVCTEGGGIREQISLLRNRLTGNLTALMSERSAAVMAGMLLGERALLDEETKRNYQVGGIMHILAISGMHISMLGIGLFMGLQYCGLPLAAAVPVSSAFMILYCLLVGNPSSAIRALVMFIVLLGARITKRSYDALSALSAAGILILLTSPGSLFLAGFQMSFAAVLGTAAAQAGGASGRFAHVSGAIGRPARLRTAAGRAAFTYAAVTCMTLPLTAFYYYELPVFGILENLLFVPLVGVLLGLGAAGCAASLFSPFLARVLLVFPDLCLRLFRSSLGALRGIPSATWICGQPAIWQIADYYILFGFAFWTWMRRGRSEMDCPCGDRGMRDTAFANPGQGLRVVRCALAGVLLAAAIAVLLWRPCVPFSFAALDVGQGDGLVIRAGRQTTFLMDGGSTSVDGVGTYRIIPYLKQQGIRHIDGIFISHADQDHLNGIEELLEAAEDGSASITVDAVFLPAWMDGTEDAARLQRYCDAIAAHMQYLAEGDQIRKGELRIRVLHPVRTEPGQTSVMDGNEGSMVIRVSYGQFDVLLTGDLEGDGETELLAEQLRPELAGIECLKVAHHGSRNASSAEFLALVSPETAIISAGRNNCYGHPHEELMERLQACGSAIYRTDMDGAVTVSSDGIHYRIESFR